MAQCLTYFCDTPQTQALMTMYGDRLQRMPRSALLDFITVFSAACNTDDTKPHRAGDLLSLANVMCIEMSDDLETALDAMDYFDRDLEILLLLGLAAMLGDGNK